MTSWRPFFLTISADVEKKWGQNCSTCQRFICTEGTSYKIHILIDFHKMIQKSGVDLNGEKNMKQLIPLKFGEKKNSFQQLVSHLTRDLSQHWSRKKVMKKVFNWSEVHWYRSNFLQNPYFYRLMNNVNPICYWILSLYFPL